MEQYMILVTIIVGFIMVTVCANLFFAMKSRAYFYSKKLTAPPWADKETKQLFRQFNRAWSMKIEKTVNVRVKKRKRTLKDVELRERWYELKKFLLLAGISKGLPMFSKKVDDIWHFFLEEEELYNQFCLDFIGEQIEHHPHEKPTLLPNERAWFDLLYLSFFNVTSRSHLWGKFAQQKKEHAKWIERIVNDSKGINESFGRHSSDAASTHTLATFLRFASQQVMKTNGIQGKRVKRKNGYWYGTSLFALNGYDTVKEKKKVDGTSTDGSPGFAADFDYKEEWNDIVTNVNSFEVGTDAGAMPSAPSDGGSSDSGSSCSSCSGCSS
ncbi:hypothetical protein FQ087_09080 [Sporosarcina sp. ANT_H38]|uniref:hypothetical protein n=1 Tax=Sporosarcina sp. ANT_H38 TaxID=2597358 RepID=UPI0011F11A11|nr:hypothetical protein [Sporosarcina sp. ANT_H38]KAA0966366.1 hypothetical protein FQ087_09080 [Sporosarcina sp. ANT_H38]